MSDTNDRLNELLIKQIERFDGALDTGVEFATAQAPELVHQLLVWKATISALGFLSGILLGIVGLVGFFKLWKWGNAQEYPSEGEGARVIAWFGGAITAAISAGLVTHSLDWLQIWIAPKLYLLEYAAGLVK